MADFIFLHHDDAEHEVEDWGPYLSRLRESGVFQGGSAIGEGACFRKSGPPPEPTAHVGGYIRVLAEDLKRARALLPGNPVYEGGGTVEIRKLPRG
jgi:hypothetical protein